MPIEHAPAMVLYVEDELFTRQMVETALEEAGFAVVVASNGSEAFDILEARSEAFQGLVTGVKFGNGPDGWDVARRARELVHGMPVVYVSGASGQEWTSKGVPNSVMIAKPFALAQIVVAVSSLLNATDAVLEN
jgi:DNA-binding response OmpR family regulator